MTYTENDTGLYIDHNGGIEHKADRLFELIQEIDSNAPLLTLIANLERFSKREQKNLIRESVALLQCNSVKNVIWLWDDDGDLVLERIKK